MRAAMGRSMPKATTWPLPARGFVTWLTQPEALDTVALAQRAREAGVAFVPGRPFHAQHDGLNTMRLAFSLAGENSIDEGVSRLGTLLQSALEKR